MLNIIRKFIYDSFIYWLEYEKDLAKVSCLTTDDRAKYITKLIRKKYKTKEVREYVLNQVNSMIARGHTISYVIAWLRS